MMLNFFFALPLAHTHTHNNRFLLHHRVIIIVVIFASSRIYIIQQHVFLICDKKGRNV